MRRHRTPAPSKVSAEVVIVGAGPAGSALAAILAGLGRDVLLLDRDHFPRPKPCGECLNPGAVAVLGRIGLLDHVRATRPPQMRGWVLGTPEGHRVFAEFPGDVRALGVDRRTLDATLFGEAARRGARVREGWRVQDVDAGGPRRPARVGGGSSGGTPFELTGSILVGADGLRSAVARRIGAVERPGEPRKASLTWRVSGRGPSRDVGRLHLAGERTVGLAPVPDDPGGHGPEHLWNATVVVTRPEDRSALGRLGESILRSVLESSWVDWESDPRLVGGPWASGPFNWPVGCPVRGRTLLVGDAAGYYDPLTGQGMYRALRGAELAAHAIDRALPSRSGSGGARRTRSTVRAGRASVNRGPLDAYACGLRHAFRRGRSLQRVVEVCVTRPWLRSTVFDALERVPVLARMLVRWVGDVESGTHEAMGKGH